MKAVAMLADEFLPTYDVCDEVAVLVGAGADVAWEALMAADLMRVGCHRPLAAVLGTVRLLPRLVDDAVQGRPSQPAPDRMTLKDMTAMPASNGGSVLLGEDAAARELVLGLVGKFWRPIIEYAGVSAGDFRDFTEPGFAKTVYALRAKALEDGRTL